MTLDSSGQHVKQRATLSTNSFANSACSYFSFFCLVFFFSRSLLTFSATELLINARCIAELYKIHCYILYCRSINTHLLFFKVCLSLFQKRPPPGMHLHNLRLRQSHSDNSTVLRFCLKPLCSLHWEEGSHSKWMQRHTHPVSFQFPWASYIGLVTISSYTAL